MDGGLHPKMRARIAAAEAARARQADRALGEAIDELERLAARVDAAVGTTIAAAVRDSCASFRAALAGQDPATAGGRMIRRFLPDRIGDLRRDCEATLAVLGARG